MSSVQRVLIVGGGIGGLTTAIALHRQGIQVEVIEKNPAWSVYGVGIIQPSNMLRALREIGIGDICLAQGQGFQGWKFHDAQGRVLGEVRNENVAGPGYPPINGITRPALHKILGDTTLAQGTPVHLGVTLEHFEPDPGGVTVRLSDGRTDRYDLVIGADGAFSQLRTMLFGNKFAPHFTGQSVWRHNFARPKDMEWGGIFFGSKSKAGLVPLSESLMYLLLVTAEPGNPRMPPERMHMLLRDRLAEYGGIVGTLREQIVDPEAVVYRPMEVVMLPTPWHRGRVLLIGDAAHSGTPHLAEGAAMAIEDGVLLARMLREQRDLESILQDFEQRRLPRTRLVYDTGIQLGKWEMAEFEGRPDPDADHSGALDRALRQLMEPI